MSADDTSFSFGPLEPPTPCASCGKDTRGRGICLTCFRDREARETEARRLAEFRVGISARFPRRYQWARFDAPELPSRVTDRRAIAAVRAAVTNDAPIVTLTGGAGTGKTTLACAALVEIAQRATKPISLEYVDALAIARARTTYSLGDEEPRIIRDARKAHTLVLDDLGQEQPAEFVAAVLRDVVFERYADERKTFVTTGLTVEQVSARYGDGAARRLFEDCAIGVVK